MKHLKISPCASLSSPVRIARIHTSHSSRSEVAWGRSSVCKPHDHHKGSHEAEVKEFSALVTGQNPVSPFPTRRSGFLAVIPSSKDLLSQRGDETQRPIDSVKYRTLTPQPHCRISRPRQSRPPFRIVSMHRRMRLNLKFLIPACVIVLEL